MIVVRLARGGSKKRPFYHFHVADKREPRDGKYIERLGFFNPLARGGEEEMRLDTDRLEYWLGQGAKMSAISIKKIRISPKIELGRLKSCLTTLNTGPQNGLLRFFEHQLSWLPNSKFS